MTILSQRSGHDPEYVRDLETAAEAEGRSGLTPADLAHEDMGFEPWPANALLVIGESLGGIPA